MGIGHSASVWVERREIKSSTKISGYRYFPKSLIAYGIDRNYVACALVVYLNQKVERAFKIMDLVPVEPKVSKTREKDHWYSPTGIYNEEIVKQAIVLNNGGMSFRVIAELLSLPSGQGLCNAVSYYRRQNNLGSGIGQGGHKSSWVARKIKAEGREQMSRGMEVCPNCGAPMPVDHVDIGVGFQRFPAYCQRCGYDEKAETGSFLRDFEEPDLKKVIKPEKLDI